MSYTPPSGDEANFSWVGTAAYTAPAGDEANFSWVPLEESGDSWATGTIALGGPSFSGVSFYDNKNPKQVGTASASPFQQGVVSETPMGLDWEMATRLAAEPTAGWAGATRKEATPDLPWVQSREINPQWSAAWAEGRRRETTRRLPHQDTTKLHRQATNPWQESKPTDRSAQAPHQVGTPAAMVVSVSASEAAALEALALARYHIARVAGKDVVAPWQLARVPRSGLSVLLPGGPETPTPRVVSTNLVFACPAYAGGPVNLVFGRVCTLPPVDPGDTIIVPIRSVYMTINNFSLFRVDTSELVPATALSLSLDVDSWTWNCSFALNGDHLALIKRAPGEPPIVLQTSINGTAIRFIVENIGRDRTFGSSQIRATGRGIAAELDEPFAPILSFGHSDPLTARQLLDHILTFNGESIGWDFGTTDFLDWLVPAGVFSHTGTYISALNAVVGAIGGYVQPHNTAKQLDVLLRYPTPAWGWSTAIPDIVLPSAVTTQEGITWLDKPDYNRVFVHGQEGGRVGRYTRLGTEGDILASPVVDPLITHADASRQRGRAIISDTGRIANVTLRLPVLAETGIIKPGRLVEYTDGPVSRIGMSRSVAIDVSMPTIYQTILVETHGD